MRRVAVIVLGALLLGAPACGDAAREKTADSVLIRAVKSMGGDATLAKIEGLRFRTKGTFEQGGMEQGYEAEIVFVWPDRAKWSLDTPGMTASMGMDGDVAWSLMMAPPARATGPAKASFDEWPIHQDMMMVRPLLHRTDVTRRLGEESEKDGIALETVHVTFDGLGEYALVFRTENGKTFLSRMTGPQTLPDGRKGTMTFSLSDPKPFGDITMPSDFAMETVVDGKPEHSLSEEVVEVEWNPKFTDETFAMPKLDMELEVVTVKELPACLGLVVVHEGPYENIAESFGKAFRLAAETGCMFMPQATCIYMNDPSKVADPKELSTEIIVALMPMGPPPTKAPEGSELRSLPATEVAAMTVRGPYGSHESESIAKVMAWAGASKRSPAGPPRVLYMHDPAATVPEDQVCEIQIPLAKND